MSWAHIHPNLHKSMFDNIISIYLGWHHRFGRRDKEIAAAEAEANRGRGTRREKKGAGREKKGTWSAHEAAKHGDHTE